MPPPFGNRFVAASLRPSSRLPQVLDGMVTSRATTDRRGSAVRTASQMPLCHPMPAASP